MSTESHKHEWTWKPDYPENYPESDIFCISCGVQLKTIIAQLRRRYVPEEQDMPDDIEDYRNERAERLFGRHEQP